MARAKSSDVAKARAKMAATDEINRGIERLQTLMAQVEDVCRDGFPYREAVRARTELALRETIRRVFGEKSDEYQRYKDHKLRATHRVQSSPTVAVIKQLVTTLEQQRSELLGLPSPKTDVAQASLDTSDKPVLHPTPAEQPVGSEQSVTATAIATPLPAVSPDSEPRTKSYVTGPHNSEGTPAPMSPAIPSTETPTDVGHSISVQQKTSINNTTAPATAEAVPVDQAPLSPIVTPSPRAEPLPTAESLPRFSQAIETLHGSPALHPALASNSSQALGVPVVPALDPVEALRKICSRFHLVARQLRLRRDGRPTLEVEDELDVQDLFGTLLKLDFDEVALETCDGREKGPGPGPCGYRLQHGRVAVIARKTRSGVTARELAELVKSDSAYYSAQGDCRLLLCFIYDPEGRIGNPRAFESDLTMVSDSFTLDVVVAPK